MPARSSSPRVFGIVALVAMLAVALVVLRPWDERERGLRAGDADAAEVERGLGDPGLVVEPADAQRAEVEQCAESTGHVAAEAPTEEPEPAPSLVLLHGTVLRTDGAVPQNAYVTWSTRDGRNETCVVDGEGAWSAGEFPPGAYDLVSRSIHCFEQHREAVLVTGEGAHRVDFVFEPFQRLTVRIVDSSGAPALPRLAQEVEGTRRGAWHLHVVATRDRPVGTLDDLEPNNAEMYGIGQFWEKSFGALEEGEDVFGTVSIRRREPAWISLVASFQVVASQYVERSATGVTFVLDPEDVRALAGGVRARFVDAATRAPVATRVELAYERNESFPAQHETGADGVLAIDDVPPGPRVLTYEADGYARVQRPCVVPSARALDLGQVELHRPVSISGTMRDAAGEPARKSVRWGLRDTVTGAVTWKPGGTLATTAEGGFTISGLVPGSYAVGIFVAWTNPATRESFHEVSDLVLVDASAGDVHGVDLRIAATTDVTLRLEGSGEPWPVARAYDVNGVAVESTWLGFHGPTGVLKLLPGPYEVVVVREGEEIARRSVVVGSEALEVDLSP